MSNAPTVSVIIPAFNAEDYLAEAIQSVLDQTYQRFEIVVVDDGSTDRTGEVVGQFDDARLKYVEHTRNRGLPAARNTGIRASSAPLVAHLDADDFFHPEKLQRIVAFFEERPDTGAAYAARYETDAAGRVLAFWRPQPEAGLLDVALGFPFAPSDLVVRREWLYRVGLFDESYTFFGEDLSMNLSLALAGCPLRSVDRALSYRRNYANKTIRDVPAGLEAVLRALRAHLDDARCPESVLAQQDRILAGFYLIWSYEAFLVGNTALGGQWIRQAVELDPSILAHGGQRLFASLILRCIQGDSDHESLLRRVFAQLPAEFDGIAGRSQWAIGRGYLLRGAGSVIWGRLDEGKALLAQAAALGAEIDEAFAQDISVQLQMVEREFGADATRRVLRDLAEHLALVGSRARARALVGTYLVDQAFQSYGAGRSGGVPRAVLEGIAHSPRFATNRGVWSILVRSAVGMSNRKNVS